MAKGHDSLFEDYLNSTIPCVVRYIPVGKLFTHNVTSARLSISRGAIWSRLFPYIFIISLADQRNFDILVVFFMTKLGET